ncbi:MAG: hypothetical protein ACYC1D_05460 [Acidimicrobiales bacterium]
MTAPLGLPERRVSGRRPGWPWVPPALAAGVVGLGLALGWRGVDLAAQVYRVSLARQDWLGVWNSQWYGGQWTPGYSVIFPLLGAAIGLPLLALLSAAGAAWAFDRLVAAAVGPSSRAASLVFAVSTIVESSIGQLPFLTGEAFGLGCMWAASRRRWGVAAALALLASLSSPLPAAFVALAALAWGLARWPDGRAGFAAIVAAAAAPVALTTVFFPGEGAMPYPAVDYGWELVVALGLWALIPRSWSALRLGALLVAVAATGSFLIPSPVGGNVGRIEDCLAAPVAILALWPRRRLLLSVVAVPLLLSQWVPAWGAMTSDPGQPAAHRRDYAPLVQFLRRAGGAPERVEVVPTAWHWEAADVAPYVALARGWERQADVADNPIFYRPGALNARSYEDWLDSNGVRFVALPRAPLDFAARAEGRLIAAGAVADLRLSWQDRNWRVYRVLGSPGLASGTARLTALGGDRIAMVASRAGVTVVRERWSTRWAVTAGAACLSEAPGRWIEVHAVHPGPISLRLEVFGHPPDRCAGR